MDQSSIAASGDDRHVDWKPAIRGRKRRAQVSSSASSRAANAAIANLEHIDRRARRGISIDREYLEKIVQPIDPSATSRVVTPTPPPSAGIPPRLLLGALAGAMAIVLVVACAGWLGKGDHTVKGVVLLDRRPLADVELQFHPASEGDRGPFRARASRSGGFGIDRLPTGAYTVTLHGDPDVGTTVPSVYENTETTPFRLNLVQDLENISLYVTSRRPSR